MSPEIQEWSQKSRSRINNLYLLTRPIAREYVQNTITDLDELKQRLRTEWAELNHVVIAAAIPVASSIDPDQRYVFYTFSCNIHTRCNQLNSNLTNLEATCKPPLL